jgi:hypothetical protein
MQDIFKGFLRLRLLGFLPLPLILALVLGIRALARGSEVLGAALVAGVLVFAVATAAVVVRRTRARRRGSDHAPSAQPR